MPVRNTKTGEEYKTLAHALADELGGEPEDYQAPEDVEYPHLEELERAPAEEYYSDDHSNDE